MKNIKYLVLFISLTVVSFGLFSQAKLSNHFNFSPSPVINASRDTVCSGANVFLYVSGISGATYNWSPGGATTDSINVNPIATTTYTVTIVQGSNQYTDSITITTIAPITAFISSNYDTVCPMEAVVLTAIASGGQATYNWSTGATTSTVVVTPSVTTTYTATVYNICGSVEKSIRINVIPLPSLTITGIASVCIGRTDTLTVSSSTHPTAYVWSDGETTTTYKTGPIDADSTIYLTAYNALGCAITDTFRIMAEICTGIDEIQNLYQFQIYPNPNNGVFSVSCHSSPPAGGEESISTVEIYNVLGEMVHKETLRSTQGDNLIKIMEQPSGVYFYKISGEDGKILGSGKFVIE